MASINVLNIGIHNNPSPFLDPFTFEVTFECFAELADGTVCGGIHTFGDATPAPRVMRPPLARPSVLPMEECVIVSSLPCTASSASFLRSRAWDAATALTLRGSGGCSNYWSHALPLHSPLVLNPCRVAAVVNHPLQI